MEHIRSEIGQNITLHYLPTDKFTTNFFSVYFLLPLRKETVAGYTMLSKLFKKGSRLLPTQKDLSRRLEELYSAGFFSSSAKHGEVQCISVGVDFLAQRYVYDGIPLAEESSMLLSDILSDPYLEEGVFSCEHVEREKKALKDQIRAAINDKRSYAMKRCREIMCENEAYSLSLEGTEEAIDALTPEGLYALYLRMLKEAEIEIFYIGNEPKDPVTARAKALCARLGEREPIKSKTVFIERAENVRYVTEEIVAVQGKLTIGLRTGLTAESCRKEKDALLLFNMLYGSSPISKLFMNLREKMSLCYYCASTVDCRKGVMFMYAGVENKKAELTAREAIALLDEVKKGNFTEEELLCAKEAYRARARAAGDSAYQMEQWFLLRTLDTDDRTPEEAAEDVFSLTKEDVLRAANKITVDTVYLLKGVGESEEEQDA